MWRLPIDQRGNQAGDHEINLTLEAIQGISMPKGGLADPQYRGLACEDILGRLPEPEQGDDKGDESQDDESGSDSGDSGDGQPKDGGQAQGQPAGDDACGSFSAPPSDSNTQADAQASQELRDDWEQRVMQAAQAAQALGVGDVPADLQRILDKIRHQGVDWRREMSDFVKDAMSQRNDWSRSARRHAWQNVIYPRKRNDDVGTVIFARDTSGSINNELVAEFTGLISDAVSEMGCRGLVIDCDTRIQAEYTVNSWEGAPLTAKGGGGTRFQPVFDRADEMVAEGEQVAGIVYLTDMMSSDLGSIMTEIPTLWLATSDTEGPIGRTVRVEL
jgi:predicted metal-dependent peptidase